MLEFAFNEAQVERGFDSYVLWNDGITGELMMNKFLNSRAWLGLLFGSCLAFEAGAQTTLTATSPTGTVMAGQGLALSFSPVPPQPLNTTSAPQTVTLSAGGGTVTFYSVGVDSSDFILLNNHCTPSLQLQAGETCTFDVEFSPVKSGARYGEVYVKSSLNGSSPIVYLYGNAALTMPQTVSFVNPPASVAYTNGGSFTVSATSSVGLSPITFSASVDSASVCSVSGNTVSILAPGNCALTASQAGNSQYSPATATATVQITKANQTVTFQPPASVSFQQGGTFSVTASATSGPSPVVTSNSTNICTAGGSNGWTITMVAVGTCSLTATAAATTIYNSATANGSVNLTTLTAQTVTFAPASPVQYSTGGTFQLSATASSGLTPFTFASSTPSVCTVSGSTASIVSVGTCTLTATQAGNGTYASATSAPANVVITKGNQTITISAPATQTFVAQGTFNFSASSSAGLSNFSYSSNTTSVCTVNGTTVTMVATGTCTLAVSEPGNTNFNAGSTTANVVIQNAVQDNCTSQNLVNTEAAFDWGAGFLKTFVMSSGESISFSIPVNAGDYGKITTVYGGTSKIISISTQKCDFSQNLIYKNCLGGGSDPVLSYVAGASRFSCVLTPGLTYYVNIRNAVLNGSTPIYPIQDSCTGRCAFQIAY